MTESRRRHGCNLPCGRPQGTPRFVLGHASYAIATILLVGLLGSALWGFGICWEELRLGQEWSRGLWFLQALLLVSCALYTVLLFLTTWIYLFQTHAYLFGVCSLIVLFILDLIHINVAIRRLGFNVFLLNSQINSLLVILTVHHYTLYVSTVVIAATMVLIYPLIDPFPLKRRG
ncbi:hypothetical protein GMRT_14680 [Giardia muris]|uniref:Uncharacterized protein n=1 Tax=Giardia muris TaxID=5742 RepID=A0A4Z1SNG0_GIAMU|nr:hypothetical protein GMRT_14680 [Giardia muris]|eukprot:TNJ26405.1 hypothetical protein GMRT_14680 [Giardia muris]